MQVDILAERMSSLQRDNVVTGVQPVRVRKPKIGVPIHTWSKLVEEPRQTIVRRVAFGKVEVLDRQPCRPVHAKADRRRKPVAAVLGKWPSGYTTLGCHRREAHRRT